MFSSSTAFLICFPVFIRLSPCFKTLTWFMITCHLQTPRNSHGWEEEDRMASCVTVNNELFWPVRCPLQRNIVTEHEGPNCQEIKAIIPGSRDQFDPVMIGLMPWQSRSMSTCLPTHAGGGVLITYTGLNCSFKGKWPARDLSDLYMYLID